MTSANLDLVRSIHPAWDLGDYSSNAAMLLADSKGAQLLVAVGTHASLVEFLDKGRSGMASTISASRAARRLNASRRACSYRCALATSIAAFPLSSGWA